MITKSGLDGNDLKNNLGRAFIIDWEGGDCEVFRLVGGQEGLRLFDVIWAGEDEASSVVIPRNYNIYIIG